MKYFVTPFMVSLSLSGAMFFTRPLDANHSDDAVKFGIKLPDQSSLAPEKSRLADKLKFNNDVDTATPWNGKKSAVVLTYDDALNVHLDNAIPLLDSLGLKATFYLSGYAGVMQGRIKDWRDIAAKGHELGNHTLFHPCTGRRPGREFVNPLYDLNDYTVPKMVEEIRMANAMLQAIDGKINRTFAYPCGDTKIHDTAYIDYLRNDFVGARGVQSEMPKIGQFDPYYVGCYSVAGQSGNELIAQVRRAMEGKSMVVFLFHGVGGEHSLNVSLAAHRELLTFLKRHENEIWIAPLVEVIEHDKKFKKRAAAKN